VRMQQMQRNATHLLAGKRVALDLLQSGRCDHNITLKIFYIKDILCRGT
jgi:hypothetical protein